MYTARSTNGHKVVFESDYNQLRRRIIRKRKKAKQYGNPLVIRIKKRHAHRSRVYGWMIPKELRRHVEYRGNSQSYTVRNKKNWTRVRCAKYGHPVHIRNCDRSRFHEKLLTCPMCQVLQKLHQKDKKLDHEMLKHRVWNPINQDKEPGELLSTGVRR